MRTFNARRTAWPVVISLGIIGCRANIAVVGDAPTEVDSGAPDVAHVNVDSGQGVADTGGVPIDTGVAILDTAVGPDGPPPSDPRPYEHVSLSKLDLLLVVDNSMSMADSQKELSARIPAFIAKLGAGTGGGFTDVHVGVITSSLGSHGTSACNPDLGYEARPALNDRGRLLPRAAEDGGTTATALTWRADGQGGVQYSGDTSGLQQRTAELVMSASEFGCGYEETWESLYHFLIDPAPYEKAEATGCTGNQLGDTFCNRIEPTGIDQVVLSQRNTFLRPDSFLAVVVVSNENDMSLKPVGDNWVPWGVPARFKQLRGSPECANVPDDLEPENQLVLRDVYKCRSCLEDSLQDFCNVSWPSNAPDNTDIDNNNLRGFHQVQRFGYNFLYDRARYVTAFGNPNAPVADAKGNTRDANGTPYVNPIFAQGRRPEHVLVATIVGVPRYLVENADRSPKAPEWDKIVGPIGVRDPHMIESIEMRSGIGKYTGSVGADDPTCADGSGGCGNGGERVIPQGADLQFACIGKRQSDEVGATNTDCPVDDAAGQAALNPLCSGPGKQPFFKAYPGLRHLRIVRDLGGAGFAGSFCNSDYTNVLIAIALKINYKAGH